MRAIPLLETTGFPQFDGQSGYLLPMTWRIEDKAVGENPLSHPLIPIPNTTTFTIGDLTYRCDRVGVSQVFSDSACDVTAYFSTDGRFRFPSIPPSTNNPDFKEWDKTFRKVQIEVPNFVRGIRTHRNAMGDEVETDAWNKEYFTADVELDVLNVRVSIPVFPEDILPIMQTIDQQKGKLHTFAGKSWVMLTPFYRQPSAGRLIINYAWESDPGTGEFGQPAELAPDEYVPIPERPPYHVYSVIPVRAIDQAPIISVRSAFPPGSNRIAPNGYIGLPGTPI